MGKLVVDQIDFNDHDVILRILDGLGYLVRTSRYCVLDFNPSFYFMVTSGSLPSGSGWYIIMDQDHNPIYVGKATNIDRRLNSNQGSLDNFAKKDRSSDPERNFIKKFKELRIFRKLIILHIKEQDLCNQIGITYPLSELDRSNVEKVINLFRSRLHYPSLRD